MADGKHLKDLQEAHKWLDQVLQSEAMKRAAAEQKNQEQFEHITKTLTDLQLQLLNPEPIPTNGSESILGGFGSTLVTGMVQSLILSILLYLV